MTETGAASSRFERLKTYLDADPENLALIVDAAAAALDEQRPADAAAMIERHAALAPLSPALINMLGLAALAEGRDADAAAIFRSLLDATPDDVGLRFNLAWALGRMGDHQAALDLVGDGGETVAAATLAVRSLHHLGRLDEAVAIGEAWRDRDADDGFWGALASVALDAEDLDRAERWAAKAPASPDGMAALGALAMAESQGDEARVWFERALASKPDSARAQLGLGSLLLEEGRSEAAAPYFDEASRIFGDHLGSWIAAGWAWLLAGDVEAAQQRFEHVIALDDTFGEAHGGLAVVAAMAGRVEDSRRHAEVALRLDRQGLGGTLARSMLLEIDGDASAADRVRRAALNAPIGVNGQTIAQRMALEAGRGR